MLITRNKGYTLLELMMTMVLAAILLTVGIPNMTNFIKNNRVLAETNKLMTTFKTARSEAMTQRVNVIMCRTSDFINCTTTGNTYMAFTDLDSSVTVNGNDTIITKGTIDSNHHELKFKKCSSCGDYVEFSSSGTAVDNNGTLMVCDDRGTTYARAIIIESIGRSKPAIDSNGNGIVENHEGNDVNC